LRPRGRSFRRSRPRSGSGGACAGGARGYDPKDFKAKTRRVAGPRNEGRRPATAARRSRASPGAAPAAQRSPRAGSPRGGPAARCSRPTSLGQLWSRAAQRRRMRGNRPGLYGRTGPLDQASGLRSRRCVAAHRRDFSLRFATRSSTIAVISLTTAVSTGMPARRRAVVVSTMGLLSRRGVSASSAPLAGTSAQTAGAGWAVSPEVRRMRSAAEQGGRVGTRPPLG